MEDVANLFIGKTRKELRDAFPKINICNAVEEEIQYFGPTFIITVSNNIITSIRYNPDGN